MRRLREGSVDEQRPIWVQPGRTTGIEPSPGGRCSVSVDSATVTFAARNLDQQGVIRDLTLSPIISNMDTGEVYYTVELESLPDHVRIGRPVLVEVDQEDDHVIHLYPGALYQKLYPPTCCISSARRSSGANGAVERITRSTSVPVATDGTCSRKTCGRWRRNRPRPAWGHPAWEERFGPGGDALAGVDCNAELHHPLRAEVELPRRCPAPLPVTWASPGASGGQSACRRGEGAGLAVVTGPASPGC